MASDSYKSAGVDIAAGNELVATIKPLANATDRPGVIGGLGQFAGIFDLKKAGWRDPLLLACTDGVGTKLRLAIDTGRHEGVGVDLVAMSVNDLVVQGAEPLLFLDYFATGRLDSEVARIVIGGVAKGCQEAGCALLGGETAEMPGMYADADYDIAGFALGAVERDALVTGERIAAGDIVLGLSSSGLHSNGFSLVRRILDRSRARLDAESPFAPHLPLGAALLTPTKLYVKPALAAAQTGAVKGMAHITGGGLIENLPRVLPPGLGAQLDASDWPMPAIFPWLAVTGPVTTDEMARVFNCGIGYCLICGADDANTVIDAVAGAGANAYRIGHIHETAGDETTVRIDNLDRALQ